MNGVFLRVDKGEPYKNGELIELANGPTIIGRSGSTSEADLPFSSPYISRKHASINVQAGQITLTDLKSKHGTLLNGQVLEQNRPYPLNHNDKIMLAKGIVLLHFVDSSELERTMEFTNPFALPKLKPSGLIIDIEKRQIILDGNRVFLSGKHTDLLFLLYEHRNQAVSYDQIKINIWPERLITGCSTPDVGKDEINALVYRLRKKLGKYGEHIISIPRYGYMLDI
ncbi:FHA domain-containing protein [Fictibacillus sp. Mic-4]|uniref:FHA domain-containing protein n=1 Tax=Fictibacillus sp. Mic-4 TaxID=3132826 RepID=UPI003CEC33A6